MRWSKVRSFVKSQIESVRPDTVALPAWSIRINIISRHVGIVVTFPVPNTGYRLPKTPP
jgi:hypothetical protein